MKNVKINIFNIHLYISKSMNIYILLLLIIKIQTLAFFKTIPTINNKYYIITPDKIIFLNNDSGNNNIKVNLKENQIIQTEDEYEKISYAKFNDAPTNQTHLLIIKDYIYAITDEGNYYCNYKISVINGGLSNVIPIQFFEVDNYFVIAMINSNYKLSLYLFKNNLYSSECSSTNLFSKEFEIDISSKSVSCHYKTNLICFYENNSNELVSSIFSVNITNNIIQYSTSYKIYNGGANIIKSIFSSNIHKYFVCYINDENNCGCITYDSLTNEWGNSTNYLNKCINKLYSINIQYFDTLNFYILSCFQAEKKFSFIKLTDSFEIFNAEDNNNYCINESLIEGCSSFSLGTLFNSTSNSNDLVKIFGICNSIIKKYEIEKVPIIPNTFIETTIKKIPTTIPTTILPTTIRKNPTTIPTTILKTTIKKIPTTIPTTILKTTIKKIPTTIPTTILPTTIRKNPTTIPTTILPTTIRKNPTTIPTTSLKTTIKKIATTIPTTILPTTIKKIPSTIPTFILPTTLIRTYKQTTKNNAILTTYPTTSLTSIQDPIPIITIKDTLNKTKEELLNNLDEVMKDYEICKIYEIFGNDYNVKISPINSMMYKNISTYINFSNCENILRRENNLSISSVITVYQIEIDYPYDQTLNKKIEYAVFNENKKRLNLSVCKNEKIEINYQLDETKINQTKVNYYSNLGIDVFDIKSDFFNDLCYPYSEKGSDIILKDRLSDIYENYSMCENNCEYNGINYSRNTIICICDVKTELNTNNDDPLKLNQMVIDTFKGSNLAVIKCYELVFDFRNKFNNIGFCIFTCLIIIHIPIYIYYFFNNITPIQRYLISEMNKFGYLINVYNPIKNSKNKKNSDKSKKDLSEKKMFKDNSLTDLNNSKKKQIRRIMISPTSTNKTLKLLGKNNNKMNKNNNQKDDNNSNNKKSTNQKILKKNYFKIFGNKNKLSEENKKRNENISSKYYSLIHINASNSSKKKIPKSNIILDNYNYKMAIKNDNRSFWRIFYICVLAKENIMNIIFFKTPLDLRSIRICLFIFNYSTDLALNTIFYTNQSISDKYHYEGKSVFVFSIVNNIVQSVFSSLISMVLLNSFEHMIDSRGDFEDIFKEEENKMRKNNDYKVNKKKKINIILKIRYICLKLKRKILFFFILEFLLMIFFYYFVTAFCEVYKNTQVSWLFDFFSSFWFSLLAEILMAWILAIFYYFSIRYKLNVVYKIVIFFYNL